MMGKKEEAQNQLNDVFEIAETENKDQEKSTQETTIRKRRRETRSRKTCLGFKESIYQAMKTYAAENDMSLNDVLEEAVVEYLNHRG